MNYHQAQVQSVEVAAADTILIVLRPAVPLAWHPGQFITMQIPNAEGRLLGRSYSIASRLGQTEVVLLIKLVEGGVGSQYVATLKVGDEVSYSGPWGKFVAQEATLDVSALFVGTGTGLAPFVPMIDAIISQNRSVKLLAGFRHEAEDCTAVMPIEEWCTSNRFNSDVTISQPSAGWLGLRGRVTDYLRAHPDLLQNAQVYICGNGSMVQEVREIAAEHGVPAEQIFFEKYNSL